MFSYIISYYYNKYLKIISSSCQSLPYFIICLNSCFYLHIKRYGWQLFLNRHPHQNFWICWEIPNFYEYFHKITFSFFQGISAWVTTMYLTKPQILELIKLVENNFWSLESLEHKDDKKTFTDMSKTLRNKSRFLITIYQLALVGYFAPFFSKGQKLVFECYRPKWLPYYFVLFFEEYACLVTIFLPINVTDFMFLTLSTLTTIQFTLLNEEFKRIYSSANEMGIEKANWKSKLRKCIQHHNFLLE